MWGEGSGLEELTFPVDGGSHRPHPQIFGGESERVLGEGSGLEELTFPVDVRQEALDWGQSQASPSNPWRGE